MAEQNKCIFCELSSKSLLDNKHFYVIKDMFPVTPGHLLIISKECVENYNGLNQEQKLSLVEIMDLAIAKVKKEQGTEFYNIGVNTGRSAGQTVMHFHMHIIPRVDGDVEDPTGGVRGVIAEKQKY